MIVLHQAFLLLHLLGAMAWVGGMFFAYFCLRPSAAEVLAPPERLPLWLATLGRFLRYMSLAVVAVVATGLGMMLATGFKYAPMGWHIMFLLGLVMAVVYAYVHLGLLPRLRRHCEARAWPAAAQALNAIRRMVALNLALGVATVIAAVSAR
ncbi:MAG: CopD family protein [Gammaproteobacteria bacterium]|nr:CopD family protein [Gammaproteobacteria bacterium]